jgi:hypothetical protein
MNSLVIQLRLANTTQEQELNELLAIPASLIE